MAERPEHGFNQDDLDRMRLIESADLSSDGLAIVYSEFTTDSEEQKDHSSLWLVEVTGRNSRRLTTGPGRDSAPMFSPDGREVAFLSDRSGRVQIHIIPVDGGEARQVTSLEQGVAGPPEWSPDGTQIAFSAGPQHAPRDPEKAYRVTRAVYRFDGLGYLDDVKSDIYVVAAAGGESRRLTDDDLMNAVPRWTPDGLGVVYTGGFKPAATFFWPELHFVDLEGHRRKLTNPAGPLGAVDFAPDGRLAILIDIPGDGRPVGSQSELYVSDLDWKSFERRTETIEGHVGGSFQGDLPALPAPRRILFLPDGRAVLPVQRGGSVQLVAIALSGPEAFEDLTPTGNHAQTIASAGNRVLYLVSDFTQPGDLHVLDNTDRGSRSTRITTLNAGVLSHVRLPKVHDVLAVAPDGQQVEGWFLEPETNQGAPHPTVLYIHGGPHSAFGHDFHADMQLLAGAGYGVLLVNHRGSSGYGNDFGNQVIGDFGNLDYLDLMAAVDRVVDMGLADPDRLGVCGLSAGGNLTCWIVSQNHRFKAAVAENPVTNYVDMFGISDLGHWYIPAEAGGLPYEIPETYARMSPITYAHRCTTPTLLVQGEADRRCPPEQSDQFYKALFVAGCPVEMVRLPNMPHAGAIHGPAHIRHAQNAALLEWMNRWVLGQTDAALGVG